LNDDDVADAAGALAATFETAARGVIYEHAPESLVARRLADDLDRCWRR
jgi:class 3 adenylate cyclase